MTPFSAWRTELLLGLAVNPATPPRLLIRLLAREADDCWQALCQQRRLPVWIVAAIRLHPDPRPRTYLTDSTHLRPRPTRSVPESWRDGRLALAGEVVRLPNFPLGDLLIDALLADDDFDAVGELYSGPNVRYVAARAAVHPSASARAGACWTVYRTNPRLWQQLRSDPHPVVRTEVDKIEEFDAAVFDVAQVRDSGRHLLTDLAVRRLSAAVVAEVLAEDDGAMVRCLAANRHTPAEIVERLLRDDRPEVRAGAARRHDLGPDQLAALACDSDPLVRHEVSQRADLTPRQRIDLGLGLPEVDRPRPVAEWEPALRDPGTARAAAADRALAVARMADILAHLGVP